MVFYSVPLSVIFFVLGGQINKLFRPIGVTLSILGCYLLKPNHSPFLVLPVLWYAWVLTLGYGENSRLMKIFKTEQKVRIVLGLLNSVPIMILTVLTFKWWLLFFVPAIVAVECIRLGSWGSFMLFGKKFDILPVDIFRGLILSIANSCALI